MPGILMVSQPTVAGVAQCALDWSLGLRELGWDPTIACPDDGDLRRWCDDAGLKVHSWDSQRSPTADVGTESKALRTIVDDVDPDVVMLHSSKAGLVGRLVLRGSLPTFFVPHAWSFDAAGGVTGRAALMWERLAALRWTDTTLCVSAAEYQRGVAAGIRGRFQVTRNGVEVAGIRAAVSGARTRVRAAHGLADDELVAVCLGRLARQKGQDVLVAAWPWVHTEGPRTLVLVGDGPDEEALRSSVGHDPTVRFTGAVDRSDALSWLAAPADVVVVPSRWEGMALVPLEALATGTPVIASDVTGLSEAVDDEVGSLVPPEDPVALAAAISAWLTLPAEARRHARQRAERRVEDQFSLQGTIRGVAAALDDCRHRRNAS